MDEGVGSLKMYEMLMIKIGDLPSKLLHLFPNFLPLFFLCACFSILMLSTPFYHVRYTIYDFDCLFWWLIRTCVYLLVYKYMFSVEHFLVVHSNTEIHI